MRSVLCTGASGYFGHGFVKKALDENLFDRICIYSRDEYKQSLMRDKFKDDERLRFFVGDVRDQARLRRACEGVHLVVHAAALKRIEVGHYNPEEMIKTNVIGSMNVIEAATDANVKKVVFLSTDKAFEPCSPYGQSKALAESLFLAANNSRGAKGPIFAVTRYGNVAGSTGSVIPKWRSILKSGAICVPMTDKNCTRFYMSLDEAVQLVIYTAETMLGGELVIPKLPAYRLEDLAAAMGAIPIEQGLANWEKLHEGMGPGNTSDLARRMTVDEIREALAHV